MNTIGEKRVRTEFNPGKTGLVDDLKQQYAGIINKVNDIPASDNPEVARLKALAMTSAEESAMWAVKAATA